MRVIIAASLVVGLAACGSVPTRVAGGCGAAADQRVSQGAGFGPSCEGPPVNPGNPTGFGAGPYADKLFESGRQGGEVGHSDRAGVRER